MTVTVDMMRSRLLSVDEAKTILAKTEPLESLELNDSTSFRLNNWNSNPEELERLEPTDLVAASVEVQGREFQLTKEALLKATSSVGLRESYVLKTPSSFIEPQLNYWMQRAEKDQKLLVSRGIASTFTRSSLMQFSNLELLDSVLAGLGDQEVLVDYKYAHSLKGTSLRLILPQRARLLERTGTDNDEWSVGLQLTNSATGDRQTSIEGYLFRWWCTNGAISQHSTSGVWNRKKQGQGGEVYAWARSAVEEVLGGLDSALDDVQALVDIPVEGVLAGILSDIYAQYKIPTAERDRITENMLNATNLNMYEVMAAVTSVANDRELPSSHIERLLQAGGDLPHTASSRCDSCHQRLRSG